jgi:hypothetical protein
MEGGTPQYKTEKVLQNEVLTRLFPYFNEEMNQEVTTVFS